MENQNQLDKIRRLEQQVQDFERLRTGRFCLPIGEKSFGPGSHRG